MKSHLQFRPISLKPGQSDTVFVDGSTFFCDSASLPFNLTADKQETLQGVKGGFFFELPNGDHFKALKFTNPSSVSSVDIIFHAGNVKMGVLWSSLQLAQTYGKGLYIDSQTILQGADALAIPQSDNGHVRKEFTITNMSNASLKLIADGEIYAIILPMTQFGKTSSGAFTLVNDVGPDAVGVYVGCEYYA